MHYDSGVAFAVAGQLRLSVRHRPYDPLTEPSVLRPKTDRRALHSRQALLAALIELVLTRPYEQISVAHIAARAGHFWHNRALAHELFTGPPRRPMAAVLVRLVGERPRTRRGLTWLVPPRLTAIQIAEALLVPVVASGVSEPMCPAPQLAQALRRSAVALAAALSGTPKSRRELSWGYA